MDGLSASASVVAIIQFAQSLKHLHDFLRCVQDAPRTVHSLTMELQALLTVLEHAAAEVQHNPYQFMIMDLLQSCGNQATMILNRVEPLNHSLFHGQVTQRKWTAIKVVFHGGKFERLTNCLERLKATLALAQSFHER